MRQMTQSEALFSYLGMLVYGLNKLMSKRKGYSGKTDPFRNFRTSEATDGVPAWVGARIRNGDKFARRRSFMESGEVVPDDSFLDTLGDSINYIGIEGGLELEVIWDQGGKEMYDQLKELANKASAVTAQLHILAQTYEKREQVPIHVALGEAE